MIVTDVKWKSESGDPKIGYYMQGYLVHNLKGIKRYLNKAWDVVGIVSGHGLVRVGKSTMALQVGYYIAWLLAGGEMLYDKDLKYKGYKSPKKEVHFNLEENIVFSPDELKTAYD